MADNNKIENNKDDIINNNIDNQNNDNIDNATNNEAQNIDNSQPAIIEDAVILNEKEQSTSFKLNLSEDIFNEPVIEEDEPPKKEKRKRKKVKVYKKRKWWDILLRVILALTILGVTALLCVVIIAAAVDFFGFRNVGDDDIEFTVPAHSTVYDVAELLEENKIIKYSDVFKAYIKYVMKEANFKFGDFTLNAAMPYPEIIETLETSTTSSEVVTVTFPEGFTVYQIAERLEANGVCPADDFINTINSKEFDYDFLTTIENPEQRPCKLEGYLFPDTYEFFFNEDPEVVIKKFLDNFNSKLTEELRASIANTGYSIDQIVNLAAIIHGEAPNSSEMAMVSGIYWNRLNNAETYPKLQSDPTRKYANEVLIPNGVEQSIADEYNTYKTDGLPTGPINNPGIKALNAAVSPESNQYYFFCSNLETGEFLYAVTYETHQDNLRIAGLSEEGLND